MEKIIESAKAVLAFSLNSDSHDFCRKLEGILIEVALLVILVIGLLRILRAMFRDGRN